MNTKYNINLEVAKIKNLPPLPEVSMKIISAVNDPEISVDDLVKVLSLSPALVARLIGLANSSYFGRAGKINDLRVAIIQVLGFKLVKCLALSIVLNVELDASQCKLFDDNFFWNHALLTAVIAQKLSVYIDDELMVPGTVYTAGLLLDIGLLAAVFVFPEQVSLVFENADSTEDAVFTQMQDILGLTHYEMGAMLLETWKLPDVYQCVVKEFRNIHYEGKQKKLILLLELSHWIATYIIKNQEDDLPGFSEYLSKLSLSNDNMQKAVTHVVEEKENINELAMLLMGKK